MEEKKDTNNDKTEEVKKVSKSAVGIVAKTNTVAGTVGTVVKVEQKQFAKGGGFNNSNRKDSNFRDNRGGGDRNSGRNSRRPTTKRERVKSEFDQKIISIRRVTRVASGGKKFNFSVAMVVGDRKGGVGLGTGKGADTALSINKAAKDAKKNLIHIALTKNMSIPYDVNVKCGASKLKILPAKGKGLVAGSSVRVVLELAGITDVTAKILSGSKNNLNNARAAMKAISIFAVKK